MSIAREDDRMSQSAVADNLAAVQAYGFAGAEETFDVRIAAR